MSDAMINLFRFGADDSAIELTLHLADGNHSPPCVTISMDIDGDRGCIAVDLDDVRRMRDALDAALRHCAQPGGAA